MTRRKRRKDINDQLDKKRTKFARLSNKLNNKQS